MIELALLLSGVIVSGGIMARRASRPAATVRVVRVASKRWSARRAAARRIKPTWIPFEPVKVPKARKARRSAARVEHFNEWVVLDHNAARRLVPSLQPGEAIAVGGRGVRDNGTRYLIGAKYRDGQWWSCTINERR